FIHPGTRFERAHPAVRDFFERISELDLLVLPQWSFGFRTGARIWHAFATWMGQLRLAVGPTRIVTRTFAIDRSKDGRADARGVLRLYEEGGPPLHVALYATHERDGVRYMNASFPLPGSQLHGVLRVDEIDQGGVVLTTYALPDRLDDAGIWLVTPLGR